MFKCVKYCIAYLTDIVVKALQTSISIDTSKIDNYNTHCVYTTSTYSYMFQFSVAVIYRYSDIYCDMK